MTRRRLLCGLLLLSAVLVCFVGWLMIASGPRVTLARLEQVKEGMSREQVIHTAGAPPGDYSTVPIPAVSTRGRFDAHYDRWLCDDGALLVTFYDDETAKEVQVYSFPTESPTLTERIRRWLGW